MNFNTIRYETNGPVAILTLDRPKALNAINSEVLSELDQACDTIQEDPEIQVVIIAGNSKVFAAGADIKELMDIETPVQTRSFIHYWQKIFRRIENLHQPVIAAVSGIAFGAGCELTLVCDIRIAAENASFALPEIKLGILPGAGGTQRLPRLIGAGPAKQFLFSGDPIDAQEAFRIGLVNKVVSSDGLMDEALKQAKTLTQRPGFALNTIKGLVNAGLNMSLDSALEHEMRCFQLLFSTEDKKEGVAAFVEKRKPEFKNR